MSHRALCVGISRYDNIGSLTNPVADATAIHKLLHGAGFESTLIKNPANDKLHEAVDEFIASVDAGDTALVFFAAHGSQFEGDNFILPIDWAKGGKKGSDPHRHALAITRSVLTPLKTRKPALNVILLDACRSHHEDATTRGIAVRGLAKIDAPKGSVIGFACAPGETALDGEKGENGHYTRALIKHLLDPVDIDKVLRRVAKEVIASSEKDMEPWHNASLLDDDVRLVPSEDAVLNTTPDDDVGDGVEGLVHRLKKHSLDAPGPRPVVKEKIHPSADDCAIDSCPAILKSGKSQGKACGKPGKYDGFCGVHKK